MFQPTSLSGFTLFEDQHFSTRSGVSKAITICKSERFGFSKSLIDSELLKTNNFVRIYFNEFTKQIAFELTNDPKNAYKIVRCGSSGGIFAKRFLQYHKLNAKILMGRYEPIINGNIFIIQLNWK